MVTALLMSIASASPAIKTGPPVVKPAIEVRLSGGNRFERGDRVRVYVTADRDGYVVVLHAEPDGRVRVLFPLDPRDDDYVRGGKSYEIRDRGDREAFAVYESRGTGVVFAAYSPDPFRFDSLVRGDHWDYRVTAFRVGDDPEADLTELARQMAGGSQFEYDLVRYGVGERVADRSSSYSYYGSYYDDWYYPRHSGLFINLSFGRPFFYDPFFYGYDPFFYDPFFFHYAYRPYFSNPYFSNPYFSNPFFYDPFFYRPYYFRTAFAYGWPYYYGYRYRYGYGGWGWDRRWNGRGRAGLSFYTFKSPERSGFGQGVIGPRQRVPDVGASSRGEGARGRVVLPSIGGGSPQIARPRVGDARDAVGSPGRRLITDPRERAQPTTLIEPRRIEQSGRSLEGRGLVPVRDGQERVEPRREVNGPRSIREVSPFERGTLERRTEPVARPEPRSRDDVRIEPRRDYFTPSRPEPRESPGYEPRAPERREPPSMGRPSGPNMRAPSAPPRMSAPSGPRGGGWGGGGGGRGPASPRRRG